MEPNKNNWLERVADSCETIFAIVTMTAILVICFSQVIARYVLHSSLSWAEEIARWLLVWITFAGSAYAFHVGAHIGVQAFVNTLPPAVQKIVKKLSWILTVGFFVFLGYQGWNFMMSQAMQKAPATGLPLAVAYAAIPIGCIMVIIRLVAIASKQKHEARS